MRRRSARNASSAKHQLGRIHGRAVGNDGVVDRVVDAPHRETLAAGKSRERRGHPLALVVRHAHDVGLQLPQLRHGALEPARAR
jgi:hypothetical protein